MERSITDIKSLTQYERLGLNQRYNMADGHAHQGQSQTQMRFLNRLTELWFEAQTAKQEELETEFKAAFFKLSGQLSVQDGHLSLLSYSASISIEIIANFLKRHNLPVYLLNPTFDNIPALLRRAGVQLKALDEEQFGKGTFGLYLESIDAPVLFFVCPNNPTGHALSRSEFEYLVDFCRQTKKILIVDFSFRFFSHFMFWDQYQILQKAAVDFITIEDTGKTWPSLDLKVGITTCNKRLYPEMYEIHNDILLNVSPFTLKILMEYIEDTRLNGIEETVTAIVETNRRTLRESLKGTILSPAGDSNLSVEWLYITHPDIICTDLWNKLSIYGVYVLPGTHFYWHQPEKGNRYIRIALMRPTALFYESALALRKALLAISNHQEEPG